MSNDRLIIPNKIMVGYQPRNDTYTGQLAYVIYYDQKGVLRKEKSWEGWRDKSFTPNHYENVPTEGFVLNKKVGGVRESYGWNTRQEYVRVYDPRGFEFEISIPNLLFILKECDCSRGKGLEGKFVYAWDATSLVLLPVASQEYVESSSFTELQVGKVSARDLIVGATYLTKKKRRFTYLGRLDYFFMVDVVKDLSRAGSVVSSGVVKRHVFWDGKRFEPLSGLTSIAQVVTDSVSPDFADLVSAYGSGAHGSRVVSLSLEPCVVENYYRYYIAPDGSFVSCSNQFEWRHEKLGGPSVKKLIYSRVIGRYLIDNGVFKYDRTIGGYMYPPGEHPPYDYYGRRNSTALPWVEPVMADLVATMYSGSKFIVTSSAFSKD